MALNQKFLAEKGKSLLAPSNAVTSTVYNKDMLATINSIYSSEDRTSIPGRDLAIPDLPIKPLGITVTNLQDVEDIVGSADSLSDWNDFFQTDIYADTEFTSVEVIGTTQIQLFGATNLSLRAALFSPNKNGYEWIVSIDDQAGSITNIGDIVFSSCDNLTELNLPNVKRFGFNTFYNCDNLSTIIAPSLLLIGDYAFENCENGLTSIDFPECLIVNRDAFVNCDSLESVNLPKLLDIGNRAFSNCTSLSSIYTPSLLSIGGGDVFDNSVFNGITGNTISFTLPQRLMTSNYGDPQSDVQTLIDNNTVNIITV